MKLLLMLGLVLAGSVFGENHTFTLKDGRTIEAEIMAFRDGNVTLKRNDGKTVPVPSNVFVEADVAYIKEWARFEGVRSSSKFKLSFNRSRVRSWKHERLGTISYSDGSTEENQVVGKTDYEEVAFEIKLDNRNKYALADLILEYNIYYEQDTGERGAEPAKYVLYDRIQLDAIKPQSRKELVSKSVTIFKDESDSSFQNAQVLRGEVHGIVCRICVMQGEKKVVLRTVGMPDKLIKTAKWTEKSKLAPIPKGGA